MWQAIEGSAKGLEDVTGFLRRLDSLRRHPAVMVRDLFSPGRDVYVARAPHAVDLLGGLAAPGGVRVLSWPLAEATLVALQRCDERLLHLACPRRDRPTEAATLELPLSMLERGEQAAAYDTTRDYFRRRDDRQWASPIAGLLLAVMREHDVRFRDGLRIFVEGSGAEGPVITDTPATLVATLAALFAAMQRPLGPRVLMPLVTRARSFATTQPDDSREALGAYAGERDAVIAIAGDGRETGESRRLPDGAAVYCLWPREASASPVSRDAIDTLQVAALMGYRIAAEASGLPLRLVSTGRFVVADRQWHGQVAEIAQRDLDGPLGDALPQAMRGADYLERYQALAHVEWHIEPERTYPIQAAVRYMVGERDRCERAAGLMRPEATGRDLERLGALMAQSQDDVHRTCAASGRAHELLTWLNADPRPTGAYGARVALCGGRPVLVVLGTPALRAALESRAPWAWLLDGSSPGALGFGHLRLRALRSALAG